MTMPSAASYAPARARSRSPSSSASGASDEAAAAVPPRWSRNPRSGSHRLSDRPGRVHAARSLLRDGWRLALSWSEKLYAMWLQLSLPMRLFALLGCLAAVALLVVMLLFSRRFFDWLGPFLRGWRESPAGPLFVFLIIFVTAFPPVVGYATATSLAGFVYGFPNGWPLAALACVAGSLCAFLASRTILSSYVDRLVGRDHRFIALGQVLRREGIWYLTGIRFCPLPFSLSNGFLATIPSITPMAFTLSTALSSPKLLIHVFISSRLAILTERGDEMSASDKAVNYLGMAVGAAVGVAVGFVIYRRTMARAAELQRQNHDVSRTAEEGQAGFEDAEVTSLLDPEDAAAVMSDDDMSLWDAQGVDAWDDGEDANEPAGEGRRHGGKHGVVDTNT